VRREGARLAIALAVAAPLTGADLLVKALVPTDPLHFHARSYQWVALSLVLLVVSGLFARLPSRLGALAGGVLAGGVLGNLVSAAWHGLRVPNPLVVQGGGLAVAFTLADVFVLAGIALQTVAALALAVRYRKLLPQSTIPVRIVRRLRARRRAGGP
jgi:hypothetical protein